MFQKTLTVEYLQDGNQIGMETNTHTKKRWHSHSIRSSFIHKTHSRSTSIMKTVLCICVQNLSDLFTYTKIHRSQNLYCYDVEKFLFNLLFNSSHTKLDFILIFSLNLLRQPVSMCQLCVSL